MEYKRHATADLSAVCDGGLLYGLSTFKNGIVEVVELQSGELHMNETQLIDYPAVDEDIESYEFRSAAVDPVTGVIYIRLVVELTDGNETRNLAILDLTAMTVTWVAELEYQLAGMTMDCEGKLYGILSVGAFPGSEPGAIYGLIKAGEFTETGIVRPPGLFYDRDLRIIGMMV